MKTWAEHILTFHFNLNPDIHLPEGISWLFPFEDDRTQAAMQAFYGKYYNDTDQRILLLGINPGRFGAGMTGIAFTDPIRLEDPCGIPNTFHKRQELSSVFVYECIAAVGGPETFYRHFYLDSICPLGFLKDGKNYNYYDSPQLEKAVLPFIEYHIQSHLAFGASPEVCVCLGKGKNFRFLQTLNNRKRFFKQIIPLPHPRWVMQYRLRQKDLHLKHWLEVLNTARNFSS